MIRAQIAPQAVAHHAVKANRLWRLLLAAADRPALTMPWHKVYIHPEHWGRLDLRAQAAHHLEQLRHDGPFAFTARYLLDLILVGYWESEHEQEARTTRKTQVRA